MLIYILIYLAIVACEQAQDRNWFHHFIIVGKCLLLLMPLVVYAPEGWGLAGESGGRNSLKKLIQREIDKLGMSVGAQPLRITTLDLDSGKEV
jgi:hypothetical protein